MMDMAPEQNFAGRPAALRKSNAANRHAKFQHFLGDAVRFENGRQVLLQMLKEGQRVHVLALNQAESDVVDFAWERVDLATLP